MTNKIKYIVVPDTHGRDFYINDMNTFIKSSDSNMVFLGDYLDPYPDEGVTPEMAIDRFHKIIEMKKNHPDRVTLLLGNHDVHYFNGANRGVRMIYTHYDEIHHMFVDNMDLFSFVKFTRVGRNNIIFSHAGFSFSWIDNYSDKLGICDSEHFDIEKTKEYFNYKFISGIDWDNLYKTDEDWRRRFFDVGSSRGGWGNHPSFIWADVTDHLFENTRVDNCIQIFGHTRCNVGQYVKFDNCYMLDCQQVFYVTENGAVLDHNMKHLIKNGEKYKEEYIAYLKKYSAFFL